MQSLYSQKKLVGFNGHTIYRVYIEDYKQSYPSQGSENFRGYYLQNNNFSPRFQKEANIWQSTNTRWVKAIWRKQQLQRREKQTKKPSQNVSKTCVGRNANKASKEEIELKKAILQKQAKNRAGRAIRQTPKARNDNIIYILVTQLASLLNKN